MKFFGSEWVRIVARSVAFLLGLILCPGAISPVYSQVAPRAIVCYSVVTIESEADLEALANQYHTTVTEILKQNSTTTLHLGATMTIRENPIGSKGISRGSETSWSWPIKGVKSSDYGWRNGDFHHGLDIATPIGSLIRAARAGKVSKTGWLGVYGLVVMIDHGNGVQTLYAHNSKLLVKVGDQVVGGEGISLSGNTGNSTGPHLHFEIRANGKTADPEDYLPKIRMPTI